MIKVLGVLKKVFVVCCVIGIVWFFLPIFYNFYGIGSMFGQFVCLYGLLLAVLYGKFQKKGMKIFMNVALGAFIVGIIWAGYLSVRIVSSNVSGEIPKDSTVVVLGCQITENGPSLSLKKRLDAAYDYLVLNPQANCIVTGGQGYNEPMTEALGSKIYLEEKGIDSNRIYLEDKSTDTWENIQFSIDIINKNQFSSNVAITTQDFHMFRACSQARDQGLVPFSVVAKSEPLMYPAHFGRELLSLTKYYFLKIFR